MKQKMSTGREVYNVFATSHEQAEAGSMEGTAAVSNSKDGVCPKCSRSMEIAFIPNGKVHYCTNCRVSSPMAEE